MSPNLTIALVATVCAVACAVSGVFLVLRRLSMMADAISHAILPGLVAGFALAQGPNLAASFAGAVGSGLLTVILVEALTRTRIVKNDSAIGLVFPAMFAIGVVVISRNFSNVHLDTDAVLFGEIAMAPFDVLTFYGQSYGPQSLWVLGICLILNSLFLWAFYKDLKITTFDPGFAQTIGVRTGRLQAIFMTLIAITTVASFSAVGSILSVALMVTPAAIASLLTRRLNVLIGLAILVGCLSGIGGQVMAGIWDVSISGMISVVLGVGFVSALVFGPEQGIVGQATRLRRQQFAVAESALIVHLLTHEGTPEAEAESQISHLSEEFGWTAPFAERVVIKLKAQKKIVQSGHSVSLTESGRGLAHQLREPHQISSERPTE